VQESSFVEQGDDVKVEDVSENGNGDQTDATTETSTPGPSDSKDGEKKEDDEKKQQLIYEKLNLPYGDSFGGRLEHFEMPRFRGSMGMRSTAEHAGMGYGTAMMDSSYYSMFSHDNDEIKELKEQQHESCQLHGHFDVKKAPGNFHVATHGVNRDSWSSVFGYDKKSMDMSHTIHRLQFSDPRTNHTFIDGNMFQGFSAPKAFTFQYYLKVVPVTYYKMFSGYKYQGNSFVTNELIGPGVFFKFDVDPIRVAYNFEKISMREFIIHCLGIFAGVAATARFLSNLLDSSWDCFGCLTGKNSARAMI